MRRGRAASAAPAVIVIALPIVETVAPPLPTIVTVSGLRWRVFGLLTRSRSM